MFRRLADTMSHTSYHQLDYAKYLGQATEKASKQTLNADNTIQTIGD